MKLFLLKTLVCLTLLLPSDFHVVVEDEASEFVVLRSRRSDLTYAESETAAASQEADQEPGCGEPGEDLDECQDTGVCPSHSSCNNTLGSFFCICDNGFLRSKDGLCVKGDEVKNVTMKLDLEYTPAYKNRESTEFQELSTRVITAIDKAYERNTNYLKTNILSFNQGSVIANIQLLFQSPQSLPLAELKTSIEGGLLGDLPVDEESIKIVEGDTCSSRPCSISATCSDLQDGQYQCTCKKGFSGNGTFCEGFVSVNAEISVDQVFTEELKNTSSVEYQEIALNFTRTLTKLFQDQPNFEKIIILAIRNGSIIVDFEVVYRTETPSTKIREVKQVVETLRKTDGSLIAKDFVIQEPPPPPVNVTHGDVKTTQIFVTWDHPSLADEFSIKSYLISFHPADELTVRTEKIASNLQNKLLEDLESDTFYNIYLRGENNFGEGENSTTLLVKTASEEKGKQMIIIIVAALVALVLAITILLACLLAKHRRRSNARRRRERNIGFGFSFKSRPDPADWSASPMHLREMSAEPSSYRRYQNVIDNYDDS